MSIGYGFLNHFNRTGVAQSVEVNSALPTVPDKVGICAVREYASPSAVGQPGFRGVLLLAIIRQ
jgi:hypothetical protein